MLTTFGQARAIQDRASLARGLALLVAAVPTRVGLVARLAGHSCRPFPGSVRHRWVLLRCRYLFERVIGDTTGIH